MKRSQNFAQAHHPKGKNKQNADQNQKSRTFRSNNSQNQSQQHHYQKNDFIDDIRKDSSNGNDSIVLSQMSKQIDQFGALFVQLQQKVDHLLNKPLLQSSQPQSESQSQHKRNYELDVQSKRDTKIISYHNTSNINRQQFQENVTNRLSELESSLKILNQNRKIIEQKVIHLETILDDKLQKMEEDMHQFQQNVLNIIQSNNSNNSKQNQEADMMAKMQKDIASLFVMHEHYQQRIPVQQNKNPFDNKNFQNQNLIDKAQQLTMQQQLQQKQQYKQQQQQQYLRPDLEETYSRYKQNKEEDAQSMNCQVKNPAKTQMYFKSSKQAANKQTTIKEEQSADINPSAETDNNMNVNNINIKKGASLNSFEGKQKQVVNNINEITEKLRRQRIQHNSFHNSFNINTLKEKDNVTASFVLSKEQHAQDIDRYYQKRLKNHYETKSKSPSPSRQDEIDNGKQLQQKDYMSLSRKKELHGDQIIQKYIKKNLIQDQVSEQQQEVSGSNSSYNNINNNNRVRAQSSKIGRVTFMNEGDKNRNGAFTFSQLSSERSKSKQLAARLQLDSKLRQQSISELANSFVSSKSIGGGYSFSP